MKGCGLLRNVGALSFSSFIAGAAFADDKAVNLVDDAASNQSLFSFNYGAPSATAVDLLGFSSSKIAPASSLGPFVLSVPTLWIGSGGQFAGLDISPVWLFTSPTFSSYAAYQNSYFNEELLRLRADIGLTNGATASDPSKQQLSGIAAGFSLPLLPDNDPLRVGLPGFGSGSEYFRECLSYYNDAFLSYEISQQGYWAAHGAQASWAVNELLRVHKSAASSDEVRALLQYLRKTYPDIEGKSGKIASNNFDEGGLLSGADAWAKANSADSMSLPLQAAVELLARVDGIAISPVTGTLPAKPDILARLQTFLVNQPKEKPGVDTLSRWLTAQGIRATDVPAPIDSDIAKMSPSTLATTIDQYKKKIGDTYSQAQKDQDKAAAAQSKAQGVADFVTGCAKGAGVLAAAQPDVSLGFGFRENGDAGHLRNLRYAGETVWLSGRMPLLSWLETGGKPVGLDQATISDVNSGDMNYIVLGGSLRYDSHAFFVTGDKSVPTVQSNKFDTWVGLEGYLTWLRLGAQVGYSAIDADSDANKKFNQHGFRWLSDAAFKVGDTGFWLGATYGTANGTTTKLNDKTFLLTFYFSPPDANTLFGNGSKSSSPK